MPNKIFLASAGAGKTTTLVDDALEAAENGRSTLLLTYTRNNQLEIVKKIRERKGSVPGGIRVKGWFSFLLEDLIRPYQRCFFPERISSIVFDQSDPHKRNGRTIPGRFERRGGQINPRYYLSKNKAHTTYISKLAMSICDEGRAGRGNNATYSVIERLSEIYNLIIVDEVQDLVGWDFTILERIVKSENLDLYCVGDFRQTIYQTSHANKNPKTSDQKIQWFRDQGCEFINHNHSWRCVEEICSFSDMVHSHQNYEPTTSKVEDVPEEFKDHIGVFAVSNAHVEAYKTKFKPVILRHSRTSLQKLCEGEFTQNFGEAKGLSHNRVLILPTENYQKYLQGDSAPLRNARTEEALNKLYVAITRARYSVAFLTDEQPVIEGVSVWTP